jgi:curli biogenesis system outer membrane secretion channel CsgG
MMGRNSNSIMNGWEICMAVMAALIMGACSSLHTVNEAPPEKKMESLKIKPGPKKVVSIYQFRSSVSEIAARGATDMFTTALVKTSAFAVVERQRLNRGVEREKKLQQSKKAVGKAGGSKLMGVDYIFEGTISEFVSNEEESEYGASLGGMEASRAHSVSGIGLDVRIIDASTGSVLDSVNVRRKIQTGSKGISGIGNFVRSLGRGSGSGLDPDVSIKKGKKDGRDQVMRDCIDQAIYEIVKRYASE